ncbi:MAG: DUF92 domain-containing protein [Armatimonadetes bacterium]|nr:DUF92 domain-containing protein [Armatimonadota bacterium]
MFTPNLPDTPHLLLAAVAACTIAGIASLFRALSLSGAIAAIFVGFVVFGFGELPAAIGLLLFFITSSALSRYGKAQKELLETYEKGDCRDAGQVMANGGVAVIAIAWHAIDPVNPAPIAAFLGALAAANADTWATEIGTLLGAGAKRKPIILATLYDGEPGQSGAVSVAGTLAALAGAAVIGATAFLWNEATLPQTIIGAAVGGLIGSLCDSYIGGKFQAQYRDGVTGNLTERTHDAKGRLNPLESGYEWINNDIVNFACTAVGATIAAVMC